MKKTFVLIKIIAILIVFNLNVSAQKSSQTGIKAMIAGASNGEISLEKLLNAGKILCTDPKFEITNFNLSVKKNNDIFDFYGIGNLLTVLMKDMIKGLGAGNKLVIEKINAKSQSGAIIELPAFVLVLK